MEYIGVYPVINMSIDAVEDKEIYKREVRYRTVGNVTALETRYYTKQYERLCKVVEDIYVNDETTYMDHEPHRSLTYFEYIGEVG